VTYALNKFGLAFATTASLFSWTLLEKRQEIAGMLRTFSVKSIFSRGGEVKSEDEDKADGRAPYYADVPLWWYAAAGLLAAFFAMFASEYYPVQLRWYGALLSLVVSAVFFIPVCARPRTFPKLPTLIGVLSRSPGSTRRQTQRLG